MDAEICSSVSVMMMLMMGVLKETDCVFKVSFEFVRTGWIDKAVYV